GRKPRWYDELQMKADKWNQSRESENKVCSIQTHEYEKKKRA
ncbi:22404_t:CDS:1, partial [Gigaspora rosea]